MAKRKKDDFIADDDEEVEQEASSNDNEQDDDSEEDGPVVSSKAGAKRAKADKPASSKQSAPKRGKAKQAEDEEEQEAPPKAFSSKVKASNKPQLDTSKPAARMEIDASGNSFGELGNKKRVTVGEYKGKTLIGIREYYEDKNTEEWKPGKNGISLNIENWEKLKEFFVAVDLEVEKKEAKKPAAAPAVKGKKKTPKSPKHVEDSE